MAVRKESFNRFKESIKEDVLFYETLVMVYEPFDYIKQNDTPVNYEGEWYELEDFIS